MKSRYSILLGIGIVIGLFFIVNLVIWDNTALPTDLFLVILLVGGYTATYTSNIQKSRVALISGIVVSILLIIYQLFINKIVSSVSVNLISFVIIPGFVMLIGGFIAKNTKNKMDSILKNLYRTRS
ncbi:MAG TPA: hypothetical protein VF324_07355 [Methanobacterium sp.]